MELLGALTRGGAKRLGRPFTIFFFSLLFLAIKRNIDRVELGRSGLDIVSVVCGALE